MGRSINKYLLMTALSAACGDGPAALSLVGRPTDSGEATTGSTVTVRPEDSGVSGTDSQIGDTGSEIPYEHLGVCGMSGEARVSLDRFEGTEDFYLIADEGMGDDLCRVRFEIVLVGESPVPCDICTWAFVVERRSPVTMTDEEGVCARSELGLDAEAIEALDETQSGYGYVPEYVGHSNVLMALNEETGEWDAVTFAVWDEETGEFFYNRRDGACGY